MCKQISPYLQTFIGRVAQHILDNYSNDTRNLAVVFPNRRAGSFLKRELAALAGKPIWAPQTFSSEEFMESLSGMTILDSLGSVLKFYEVYKTLEGDGADSLEKFITWAPTLIKDFNEIDLFGVEASQLLTYLSDVKQLESWNPEGNEPSEIQKAYLAFWTKLPTWHAAYTQQLKAEKQGYQGLVFREVANAKLKVLGEIKFSKIIFAGFNAINVCEKSFFTFLVESGKADFMWDLDTYYSDNPIQEAGLNYRSLRNTALVSKAVKPVMESRLAKAAKNITITAVPLQTAQARTMNIFLEELNVQGPIGIETAVVLGDEGLLYPVLSSIPASAGLFNATLGLPYKSSKAFAFLSLLLEIIQARNEKSSISAKLFISFLQHPYTAILLGDSAINALSYFIRKERPMQYYKPADLLNVISQPNPLAWLTEKQLSAEAVFEVLNVTFKHIEKEVSKDSHAAEMEEEDESLNNASYNLLSQELLFTQSLLKKLNTFIAQFPADAGGTKSLEKIIAMLASKESIPLMGEPLKGLQVMGMLETRNLDFTNLILLGLNEGKVPSSENPATFITHDTRFQFGLPTQHDRDAVFAYHFYRLLQRATNVWFVYDTDEQKGGEPSRFLLQVEKELAKLNPNITLTYRNPFQLPNAPANMPVIIEKTAEHLAQISLKAEKGFAPTLLNTLRKCSLQFYLSYLANIEPNREEDDMLAADIFGKIIHSVLEDLFQPWIGVTLTPQIVRNLLPLVKAKTDHHFEDYTHIPATEAGRYILDIEIANYYVNEYLNHLANNLQHPQNTFSVFGLEQKLKAPFTLPNGTIINLSGGADRIDLSPSGYRIVDYKTGAVDASELKLKTWDELITGDSKRDKAFQMLLYSYILHKQNQIPIADIVPTFISMRAISGGYKQLQLATGENKKEIANTLLPQTITEFEEIVQQIIAPLFDPETPFTQTTNKKTCRTCGYKTFCGRERI